MTIFQLLEETAIDVFVQQNDGKGGWDFAGTDGKAGWDTYNPGKAGW
jgi:hypothetical protein